MTVDLDPDILLRVADQLAPEPDPYMSNPVGWVSDRLGENTWSKQDDILESVRDNRYTAVRSAHSTGKSHIAARAIAWWIDTHPLDEVFVISTAPSAPQVKAILWRYIKSIHRRANLPGYITEGEVPEWKIDGRLVGWGRKPADMTNAEEAATAFQGIHAKYVLVVLDEAGGVPEWLWNAVDSIVTAKTNRVLAIGNPDDPASHFEKVNRPGSGWNVIKIAAQDTPSFTGESVSQEIIENLVDQEWVTERARVWGEESPLYTAKVLAEFPTTTEDNLIQFDWIRAAMERDFSGEMIADYGKFAIDVARQGNDEATFGFWRGGVFRITRAKRGINNAMAINGWISSFVREHPAVKGIVDADGIGGPVFDRARELNLPVSPFYAARRAFKPKKFYNRRSEQWWALRELFQDGLVDIDPNDEALISQLASIKWEERSDGRIYVETKKEMKKRGLPSPDRADTLMMVTAPMEEWLEIMGSDPATGLPVDRTDDTVTGDLLKREMM